MSELVWIGLERLKLPKLVVLVLALVIVAFPRPQGRFVRRKLVA
jgi:hypothetical protein